MNITNFIKKYEKSTKSSGSIFKKWEREKDIDDFLGTTIMAGVVIGDLILDGTIADKIDTDTFKAFSELMKDKANSFDEIRALIVEKSLKSDASIGGLLNKVQGQLGENTFIENIGTNAHLAESGSQAGWDVRVEHGGDVDQYIQVKIYKDADGVIEKMKEVNNKLPELQANDSSLEQIDFAVNSDIYEEVKLKALEQGFTNQVYDVGATRDDLRGLLESNFENLENYSGMENFFGEVLGGAMTAGAIHAVVNGFFLWKGTKEIENVLEDTIHSTAISAGGIATSIIVEDLFFFAGPITGVLALGAGIGTRSVLKRISERRHFTIRLDKSNRNFQQLCLKLSKLGSNIS